MVGIKPIYIYPDETSTGYCLWFEWKNRSFFWWCFASEETTVIRFINDIVSQIDHQWHDEMMFIFREPILEWPIPNCQDFYAKQDYNK